MDPRSLDLAAELCALVGAPSLFVYLEATEATDAAELRSRLKKRRKYMQGMQGNPKYKQEAVFLIKHFSALHDVLDDVSAYKADLRRRAESEHLPVLEMTIRGVLASGGLNADQYNFLRHNAIQLGIAEATFEEALRRAASESGIPMVGGLPTPTPAPMRNQATDLYAILGLDNRATVRQIEAAYAARRAEVERGLPDPDMLRKLDIAKKVLSNEAARIQYDQTASRTGPPARRREFGPPGSPPTAKASHPSGATPIPAASAPAATAPPVRGRELGPGRVGEPSGESRLEILSEPVRRVRVRGTAEARDRIHIRNGGAGPMPGVVSCDVPWVRVQPAALDAGAAEQHIEVIAVGAQAPEGASTAVVTITTARGERARVVFELQRTQAPPIALFVGVAIVLVIAVVLGVVLQNL